MEKSPGENKLTFVLIAAALAALILVFLCRTPHGFVSPGTGLLLKLSALQELSLRRSGKAGLRFDAAARRAANESDIILVDGRHRNDDGVTREDMELVLPGRTLAARLYRPGTGNPKNIILSYHGGGFVVGSLQTNDTLARDLCTQTASIVLSVDYRLAPEHPFPAAHDDALESFLWVREEQAAGRLPVLPVWVSGDSAGGNLAASVCQMARTKGVPLPAGQLLFYPATDVSKMDTVSYGLFETGYLLTKTDMEWFRDQYLKTVVQRFDTRVSPLLEADLSGLPPALVLTAGKDVLRDEGEAYAERLRSAGVSVELRRFTGLVHGFAQMRRFIPAARRVPGLVNRFMREHSPG
jgi:acetyl esterase